MGDKGLENPLRCQLSVIMDQMGILKKNKEANREYSLLFIKKGTPQSIRKETETIYLCICCLEQFNT